MATWKNRVTRDKVVLLRDDLPVFSWAGQYTEDHRDVLDKLNVYDDLVDAVKEANRDLHLLMTGMDCTRESGTCWCMSHETFRTIRAVLRIADIIAMEHDS